MTSPQHIPFLAPPAAKPAAVVDFTTYRITMVEQRLNDATMTEAEIGTHLMARYGQPAQVAHILELDRRKREVIPPDAVASPDEENEYEALAYELYAAIRELVSGR